MNAIRQIVIVGLILTSGFILGFLSGLERKFPLNGCPLTLPSQDAMSYYMMIGIIIGVFGIVFLAYEIHMARTQKDKTAQPEH